MEEAAEADNVVVIDNGLIAAKGTPAALKEQYASDLLRLIPSDEAGLMTELQAMDAAYTRTANVFEIKIGATMEALPILIRLKPYLLGFEVQGGTMDDAFIGITGKELRQ